MILFAESRTKFKFLPYCVSEFKSLGHEKSQRCYWLMEDKGIFDLIKFGISSSSSAGWSVSQQYTQSLFKTVLCTSRKYIFGLGEFMPA